MRIGTWNVEYGESARKNALRIIRLRSMEADVWVLTETHDVLDLGPKYVAASTTQRPGRRLGSRWTTIWSRLPIAKVLSVEDPNRTVAVLINAPAGPLLLYGTVLPWQTDRGPAGDGKGWTEHYRVIPQQAREWLSLQASNPGVPLCVAGDLNSTLGTRAHYGTAKGRALLQDAFSGAGLVCITDAQRTAGLGLTHPLIDHICLTEPLAERASVRACWEGRVDGVKLSDHIGVVVEIAGE